MSVVVQEISDRVLHITLNRPDKRNAIDDEMFDALVGAAEAAGANEELAAGQRPYADPDDPNSTGRTPGRGQRIVRALRDAAAPVIAALHGHAIGGGLQIALGADIRIVTADVQLACAEIEFGMTVDMGASQLLPRLIGADRTMDLLFSGRRITGVQADEWGLATRVSADPVAEALELAHAIAQRNSKAVVETKRLVRLAETATVEAGMSEELSVMARNIGSPAQVAAVERYFADRRG